jgi:hypothetical protein
MKEIGKPPKKNTSEWKRNEKIINENPVLRAARDVTEGLTPGKSTGTGGWTPTQAYKDNYDAIFGKNKKADDDK